MEKKKNLKPEIDMISACEDIVRLTKMIKHSSIIERDMFYNKDFKQDLDRLACALSEDKYKMVSQKLIEKKMQPSFTCIFYGAPGTGKTETVKQLAFQTKRDIMKVDLSEIRSKWIGESEKRMKAIFDEYQKAVENSLTPPILLFNEADGIFGRRTEAYTFAEKSENTLQNIILEGMENLRGILIATTNLIDNLDSAMDRRFLFKLYFPKPDEETRRKLFKSIIPEISDKTIKTLAKRYELSGGHIQNVGKRLTIDTVLYGEKMTTLEALDNYCRQEEFQYGSHP